MRLPTDLKNGLREMAVAQNDKALARIFREKHPNDVEHLSDEQLQDAVCHARTAAHEFGIGRPELRVRFIMLHVLRIPNFWFDATVAGLLNGNTGTPDMRFGDVFALFKIAAIEQGADHRVWW